MKRFIKATRVYRNFIQIRKFFRYFSFSPIVFIVPALLALLSAFFEGLSLGLLIPLIRGFIESNFDFVKQIPIFDKLILSLPNISGSKNYFIFFFLIGLIATSAVLKNLFQYFSALTVSWYLQKFAMTLRQRIYERYLKFGMLFFAGSSMGALHQILVGYANQVSYELKTLQGSFYSIFNLLISLGLMFFISWKLTVFLFFIFPVLHFSIRKIVGRIKMSSESFSESFSSLGKKISNALFCIPLVKAYVNESNENKAFAKINEGVRRAYFNIEKNTLIVRPIQETFMIFVFLGLIVVIAFWESHSRNFNVAGYAVFFLILRRSMASFGVFNTIASALASVRGPVKEIKKIFDDKNKFFIKDGIHSFPGLKGSIEFKNLSFSYPKGIAVLKGINLTIEKGKTTAVVGSTGSGKTTLINLLMRFYDSPPNSIYFDGRTIEDFNLKSFRSHIAIVNQEAFLFNDTLEANLIYGLDIKPDEAKIFEVLEKSKLTEFVERLPEGLLTQIGDRGVRLSGGEKQRLSIARAILKGAEVVVLDEATSALDSKTEKLIQEAIDEAIKDKTAIVVAHRLSTIRHADRIIVLEGGQVVEAGSLDELLEKKGKFFEYWEEQKFV